MVFKCGAPSVLLTLIFILSPPKKVGLNFGIYRSGKKSGAKVSGVRTIEADGIKGLS